ncbi:MAG: GAF domain-containing protein, partial [Anaerolineales bacterium]|nr:GAF domain-containing protein [Anaerolineales bacterium]
MEFLDYWFRPPQFEDPQKQETARFLYIILAVAIPLLLGLIFLSGWRENQLWTISNFVISGLIAVCILNLIFLKRGFVVATSWVMIMVSWLGMTFLAYRYSGIRDTAYLVQVVLILAAGLLLGSRVALLVTMLAIATGWGLAYAEQSNLIYYEATPVTLLVDDYTFIFVLIGVMVYLLISNLSKTLAQLQESNRQLQMLTQNLEAQVAEGTLSAVIARQEAEEALELAKNAQQTMEDQFWLTAGQAKLAERLQGNRDLVSLTNNCLDFLCDYLEIPVGNFFVVDGDHLQLMSSYSFVPTETHLQRFELGEGIIGQAALLFDDLVVTQVPPGYLSIQTAVGKVELAMLYHLPVISSNRVFGVLEFGTMRPLSARTQQFLHMIVESIAIA